MREINPGDEIKIVFPFKIETYNSLDEDGEVSERTWVPGISYEGDGSAFASGEGEAIYHVVDVHKVLKQRYVFYIRQWKSPDGKIFGKKNVRVKTLSAFSRATGPYGYDYYLDADHL